jgi:pyruvate/2-oxoglutarate dehydrogenase complex dihydrolipoamide dehydrogenase (E3) component
MKPEHFEFAVVGGGKGGKTLAAQTAVGRPTVMVEKGMIGGGCINFAYMPTKTLVKSAKVAHLARRKPRRGLSTHAPSAASSSDGRGGS